VDDQDILKQVPTDDQDILKQVPTVSCSAALSFAQVNMCFAMSTPRSYLTAQASQ
jgi:hypothetical protein